MTQYVPLARQDMSLDQDCYDGLPTHSSLAGSPWKTRVDKQSSIRDRTIMYVMAALPRFARPGGLRHRAIGPSSYLDALRGYASFAVFISHAFNSSETTWRTLPFVSIFFNGAGMVALFFVISGYALGHRFLVLIRRQESDRLLHALASSTFRRYVRLYLSSVIAIVLTLPLVRYELYDGMVIPIYKEGLLEQTVDCIQDIVQFCNPFADVKGWVYDGFFHPKYLGVLWTIPLEYRGSIALFSFCTAACQLSTRSRMVATWIVIVACYVWQAVYVSEFMVGLWIADLTLDRHPERLKGEGGGGSRGRGLAATTSSDAATTSTGSASTSSLPSDTLHPPQTLLSRAAHTGLLILGLFLLGAPPNDYHAFLLGGFPWTYLRAATPSWWTPTTDPIFWFGPGAALTVYALEFCPALQRPLHGRVSQYLGDVSFGVYAVHVPTVFAVLWHVMHPLRDRFLGPAPLAHLPGAVVTSLVVVAAGDYFSRIDARVVAFARWLQRRLFVGWHESPRPK